jgi:hypothetical protein
MEGRRRIAQGLGPARTAMAAGPAALTLAKTAATLLAMAARGTRGRVSGRRFDSE